MKKLQNLQNAELIQKSTYEKKGLIQFSRLSAKLEATVFKWPTDFIMEFL